MTYSSYKKRKKDEEKKQKEHKKVVMAAMVGAYNPRDVFEESRGNVLKVYVKESRHHPPSPCFSNLNIKSISSGAFHCICYTQEKHIIGMGANNRGQLGMGHFDDLPLQHKKRPQRLRFKPFKKDPPFKIICGRETTYILTTKGKVFAMGANNLYQLGQSHDMDLDRPTMIDELAPITDIQCGDEHAFFYSSIKHLLYVCGSNSAGQLGLGTLNPHEKLSVHGFFGGKTNRRVAQIACGSAHTIILTESGDLFGMGRSDEGAMGNLIQIKKHDMPLVLETAQIHPAKIVLDSISGPIVSISAGWNHSIIIAEDGICVAGSNDYGQTQPQSKLQRITSFVPFTGVPHSHEKFCDFVSTADNNTCLVANQRHIYTWGEKFGSSIKCDSLPTDAAIISVTSSYNKIYFLVEFSF